MKSPPVQYTDDRGQVRDAVEAFIAGTVER
jgi:hypothetical protein